jgi:hypothetical protein
VIRDVWFIEVSTLAGMKRHVHVTAKGVKMVVSFCHIFGISCIWFILIRTVPEFEFSTLYQDILVVFPCKSLSLHSHLESYP